jgi:pimeloyl-ACP methyl ester carboxylesterase
VQKPNILLLPGLACDDTVWKHQAAKLGEIANVSVVDYGSSVSIEKMASVALEHAPERFAVAGHSMGGRVAFEVFRHAPARVIGMAQLDTAYRSWKPGEAGEREKAERMRLVALARAQGMRAMATDWVQRMVHPSRLSDKPLIDSILDMFARKTPEIFAGQINALLNRPDATAVLSTIHCPTLILCGREDSWSVLATHEEIAAQIPGNRFVVIENCGHMAPMEKPQEVTDAMLRWFETIPRSSS